MALVIQALLDVLMRTDGVTVSPGEEPHTQYDSVAKGTAWEAIHVHICKSTERTGRRKGI